MTVVQLRSKSPVKKLSVSDMINNLVGKLENVPTERDIALSEEMEELADIHGGEFDPETNSVTFEGKDSLISVYASTDMEDNPVYQAVHVNFKPHVHTAGKPTSSFKEALALLNL